MAIAIGALSVAACGGQSGSIPGSGARVPAYAVQAGLRSLSAPAGAVPAQVQETVLHRFAGGSDGESPNGNLIEVNGEFYGTTVAGGTNGLGTVFKITASGAESIIHSFAGGSDGSEPFGGLTDVDGVLYGTTSVGGSDREGGTVFKITTSGEESVLHRFYDRGDGVFPIAGLTNVNGVLYGTTSNGGDANGDGTIFKITTSGAESLVYKFRGSDGGSPLEALTNVNGVLYGTTYGGGDQTSCTRGCGTGFKITTAGAETVLHSFGRGTDGQYPSGSLTDVNGELYGTTSNGGANGDGTVFKITISGTEALLHSFGGGSDGRSPGGLTDVNGVLYGTTFYGGADYNTGTIFKITTSGAKSGVYRFVGGSDGRSPSAALTYVNGVLYGTTAYGGDSKDFGTVFSLSL